MTELFQDEFYNDLERIDDTMEIITLLVDVSSNIIIRVVRNTEEIEAILNEAENLNLFIR